MLILYDQLQDRPETFSQVKILCPAPLLPGIDGEQLQGILGGQRPLLLQFAFTLREEWKHQRYLLKQGGDTRVARRYTRRMLQPQRDNRVMRHSLGGLVCGGLRKASLQLRGSHAGFLVELWLYVPSQSYNIVLSWISVAQTVENLPATRETRVPSLGQKDPLEEGMATHSCILAWGIPWTEEPGGLQSVGLQRVGHD